MNRNEAPLACPAKRQLVSRSAAPPRSPQLSRWPEPRFLQPRQSPGPSDSQQHSDSVSAQSSQHAASMARGGYSGGGECGRDKPFPVSQVENMRPTASASSLSESRRPKAASQRERLSARRSDPPLLLPPYPTESTNPRGRSTAERKSGGKPPKPHASPPYTKLGSGNAKKHPFMILSSHSQGVSSIREG